METEPGSAIAHAKRVTSGRKGRRRRFWRKLFKGIRSGLKQSTPLLRWSYLVLAIYVSVGILLFPAWWKRALFHGGIFEAHYLRFGVYYLSQLFLAKHPLGLLIPALLLTVVVLFIYGAGKRGLQFYAVIQPPSFRSLLFFSVIMVTCCLSLFFVQAEYSTPEEFAAQTQRVKSQLNEPLESFGYGQPAMGSPGTGYFLYLDKERVANAYNSLQQGMIVASETIKRGKEASLGVSAGVVDWKVDSSGKLVQEQSIVKVPTTSTPERQIQYLIAFFSRPETQASVVHLWSHDSMDSFRIQVQKLYLQQFGVQFTPAEQQRFDQSDFDRYAARLKAPNQVLFYNGTGEFRKAGKDFTLFFQTTNPRITATGSLNDTFLEPDLRKMLELTNKCQLSCNALVIEWKTEVGTNSLDVRTIPLAVW